MSVTEKTYPIEQKWIIKSAVLFGIIGMIFIVFIFSTDEAFKLLNISPVWGLGIFPLSLLVFIILKLMVANYQFSFSDQTIVLRQGILSKSERHIPYGRIQQICISQGLINRLLGLASVSIETASEGAGRDRSDSPESFAPLGYSGNKIGIPGVSYENAINLKNTLMKLMVANPIYDAQSGL